MTAIVMKLIDRPGAAAILTRAMALAEQGVPCFPCQADKSPATPRGFKDASCDQDVLHDLWRRYAGPLVGVPTGERSGLDVLDIDPRHRGESWIAAHQHRLPPTRVHRTRAGGLHLLFQHKPGLRCSAGKIAAGVDVRASGGYVIWWPAAGIPVLSDRPLAAWPDWLTVQLSSAPRSATPRITVPDGHAMIRLVQLVASARPGERNNLTYWAACRAGEMVASGLLGADAATAVIAEAATRAGLPRAEAERTARSGIRAAAELAHA
jgi:hypothetical protein